MHILISFSLAGQLNSLAAVFEQVPFMFTSQFGDGLAGRKNLDGGGRGVDIQYTTGYTIAGFHCRYEDGADGLDFCLGYGSIYS